MACKFTNSICKFNVSGFRCHPLPVIFSCTKKLIMLLDIANRYFLPYSFVFKCFYLVFRQKINCNYTFLYIYTQI